MYKATQFISQYYRELEQFLKSTDVSKALLVGLAVTTPILLGIWLGYLEIGLALCFGAFWCSPSDVNGSQRHKGYGILFSAILIMAVSFVGGYLQYQTWLSLPILGILGFAIAFLSVYGFRASLISFSGLLALVLSFAYELQELKLYQYALLIGVGGLWYLLLATVWYRLNPKRQTEEILSKTFIDTAAFLENRGRLIEPQNNRKELQSTLFKMQSELTEEHETLREILIQSRRSSGKSYYQGRRLLVFVELVEIMETAIANPVNYAKMDSLFERHPEYISSFQNLIMEMALQLRMIAKAGNDSRMLPDNKALESCFEKVQNEITAFGIAKKANDYEGFLMLQNFLEYQGRQFSKLKRIKRLLGNTQISSEEFIDRDVSKQFIVSGDYDPRIVLRNLSFRSNIFRHSLRLSATLMVGYAVGNLFPLQNPYWILLTIIVIMRPSYGLTKTRSKDRIIGTLIGGALATGFVLLIQNAYVYGALGIVSLVIAFAMVQKNYKASATFITLSVIFIYAILQPDVLTVIQYRIVDTVLGAGLSFLAIAVLWPSWGFLEIKTDITKSVTANQDFLRQIADHYQKKGKVPAGLKVSRKNAFLETSNLSAAFQRMAQEPRSKQRNIDAIYQLVEHNHAFLSSLASLSTYVQHHKTSAASNVFKEATSTIDQCLSNVLESLNGEVINDVKSVSEDAFKFKEWLPPFQSQEMFLRARDQGQSERDQKEAHLFWEQLGWLHDLSAQMLKLTMSLK